MKLGRAAKLLAVSAALHAPVVGPPIYKSFDAPQAAVAYLKGKYQDAKYEHRAYKARKQREELKQMAREGKIGLGEFILRANEIDLRLAGNPRDFDKARSSYRELLSRAREKEKTGKLQDYAHEVFSDYDYSGGFQGTMADMLIEKSGKCNQISHIIAAVASELGYDARFRLYSNHLAPVIVENGTEHNISSGRPSYEKGILFAAEELVDMYDSENGGFRYPVTRDRYPGSVPLYLLGAAQPRYFPPEVSHEAGEAIHIPFNSWLKQANYDYLDIDPSDNTGILLNLTDPNEKNFSDYVRLGTSRDGRHYLATLSKSLDELESALETPLLDTEKAYLAAISVALYQEVAYVAALLGKQKLVETAESKKQEALDIGSKAMQNLNLGDIENLNSYTYPFPVKIKRDIAYLVYLPEGKDMLLQLSKRYLKDPNPVSAYFYANLLKIAEIAEQVADDISTLPIEKQIAIVHQSYGIPVNCQKDFCRIARNYREVLAEFGLDGSGIYIPVENSKLDFSVFLFRVLRAVPPNLEGRWFWPLMVSFKDSVPYMAIESSLSNTPLTQEDAAKTKKFLRGYNAWIERNK